MFQEKKQGSEECHMKTTCRKKYRIKSKFRFITSVVIMAGLMIGIIGAVSGLNVSRALTETKYKEVQICYGDTLWDIANTYKSDDTDFRWYKISKAQNKIA